MSIEMVTVTFIWLKSFAWAGNKCAIIVKNQQTVKTFGT